MLKRKSRPRLRSRRRHRIALRSDLRSDSGPLLGTQGDASPSLNTSSFAHFKNSTLVNIKVAGSCKGRITELKRPESRTAEQMIGPNVGRRLSPIRASLGLLRIVQPQAQVYLVMTQFNVLYAQALKQKWSLVLAVLP